MKRQCAKRLLAGLLCVSLIFQSGSVISFAAEQDAQEESLESIETAVSEGTSTENESLIQEGGTEKASSEIVSEENEEEDAVSGAEPSETQETEKSSVSEETEPQESPETENPEIQESVSAENPETQETATAEGSETEEMTTVEKTENDETEQSTTQETKVEREDTNGTEDSVTLGEFQNVSVVFDGYLAIIDAEFVPASDVDNAAFQIVSYDENGTEITSASIYSNQDDSTNIYSISQQSVKLYNNVRSIKIMASQSDIQSAELESVYSEEFLREQIPEIHFSAGEPQIEAGSITIPYYFDGNMYRPEGREYDNFYMNAQLKYGIDNVDEMSSGISGKWFKGEEKQTFSVQANGLEAETTYHVKLFIEISGTDSELGNIYEQTITLPDITTPTDTTYDLDQEFPDEVFRELIKNRIGLDETETTVTGSQLGTITSLYIPRNDITTPAIQDIRGIELLYNLTNIELDGHEITDISSIKWENLTRLTSLSLRGNRIEILPDFRRNTNLRYLYISDNFISPEDILNRYDKLPEGCNCWEYGQRPKEFELVTEQKYYQTNGKSEVAVRIQGHNRYFSPVFKIYIDNELIETQSNEYTDDVYSYNILYNQDIPYETGSHTLKFEMYEGSPEELTVTKEVSFEIVGEQTFLMNRSDSSKRADVYYMSAQEDYLSVNTYSAKEVTDIYLVKEGIIYGKNDWLNCNGTDTSIKKYPQLGSYSSDGFYYSTSAGIYINKKQLAAGTYDLKLVFQDNTEEILDVAVEVINSAVITSVNAGSSYDHTGEYLYLALAADYLDPAQINYTIKNSANNRTLQTEYVDCKPIYNGYVVKLKKTGWDNNITGIDVHFSGKEDYPLYVATSNTYCNIENMLYFSSYNYQSNMLEIGITAQSNIEDYIYSIVRTDSPWDFSTEHIQEEYTVRLEEVEDTIYNVIPKWEGEECTLYGGYYRFSIMQSEDSDPIRCEFHIPGLVIERSKRLTDNGNWEDSEYHFIQQGIGKVTRSYYSEIPYAEGNAEDFSAQITGNLLESPLDAQSISTWNHSSDVYKTAVGMEFDYSALKLGDYTIELYYRNNLLSTFDIQVIPDNIFVMYDYFYAHWNSEDEFYVNFYTPDFGDEDDYTVALTDINGNEIQGLTITGLWKYTNRIGFYVSGLKQSEADRYYYIKILHKTKGDALSDDLETKYYKHEYGKYTRIDNNSKYGWNTLYVDGVSKGITGIWQDDSTIFPATLNIYKFNGTERYYSRILTEEDFNNGNFYFTQDIIDALPRANGYYDLVLTGNAGQFLSVSRDQVALDTDILNAFRVVPSSMTLKIDVAEESSKVITVFNSPETPVFESDDTTIAEVTVSDDDPNVATVEAVGVGRTSITVTSGSNIEKVIVEVTEAPVEAEKIAFQQETVTAVQGMPMNATVDVEPDKAWTSSSKIIYSSSDETIVSVGDSTTRNVTLMANNPGTATITAKLEGTELTAQCMVTVIAGFTEEEKTELISSVGDLYLFINSENSLSEVSLPQGWRWSDPSQKPTADSDRPIKEFTAIYTKDGLDYFSTLLPVCVTGIDAKITGADNMQLSTVETYKITYDLIGYKPTDNSIYVSSVQWTGNENLKIQGEDNNETVRVQAGVTAGNYVLQCTINIKNTKSGKTVQTIVSLPIDIKDFTDEIVEAAKKKTYYFLSGADTSINSIPIGDGWNWGNPDMVPQADSSIPVQNFAAYYTVGDKQPVQTRLSVAVSALEEVRIKGVSKMASGKMGSYKLQYQFEGYDITDANGFDVSYQWKGSEGIFISGGEDADTVTIKTGDVPGNYTLIAIVTVTNKHTGNSVIKEGQFTIQVLDKDSVDSITIKPASHQPEKALDCVLSNGALESDYAMFDKNISFQIQLEADTVASGVTKNTPVQWASSDTKVAAINAAGLITVKKAGIAVISATSTDRGGYSEEILLKIQDFTPALDKKSIVVSQYSSMGAEIGLTAQNGNEIQEVSVSAAGLKAVENAGVWYLEASGYSNKTVENVVLRIFTHKGEYQKQIKVTVDVTRPKATLKQTAKPNIFYTDAKAVFKVTSKYVIERIEDASNVSETCFHVKEYDAQAGVLTLEPGNIIDNIESYKTKNSEALKAKLKITFEGYSEPVEVTVKVSVQNKKPSLRIDPAVFVKNTGMNEAITIVRNGKTAYHLGNAMVESKFQNVGASISGGRLRLNYSGTSNMTYKVDIQDKNWTQPVTVSGKIQMINADALTLQAETLKVTANKANLSTITIPVSIKGSTALEPDIRLEYDVDAMKVWYQNGAVNIQVLEDASDKTYKVAVGGSLEIAGRTIDIKKAVIKITVTSKVASVKLFASGKINIAERTYSATTYTPTLKNMDANIIRAEVTGDMSEYFYAYLDESDKVVLKAVPRKPLKANVKYTVDIMTYFDNGYNTTTTVNIKPINKLPKVKASLSKGTLYKTGADSRIGIRLTLDACYSISQVKLADNSNSQYFALKRDESGLVVLTLSEYGMKMPSGTYTVPYQILIGDADNTKPITQKIKVTVK